MSRKNKSKEICPCCLKQFKQLSRHLSSNRSCQLYYDNNIVNKKPHNQGLAQSIHKRVQHRVAMMKNPPLFGDQINLDSNRTLESLSSSDEYLLVDNEDFDEADFLTDFDDENNIMENNGILDNSKRKLFTKYKQMLLNNNQHLPLDYEVYINLLKILVDIDAPLYAFETIMNWAAKSASLGYQFNFDFPKRDRIISKMAELFCLDGAKPFEIEVQLSNESIVKVVCFDFQEMCYSILSDENIMKDDNYTLRNNDPRNFVCKGDDNLYLECVEDGIIYQDTATCICLSEEDFCLGIKLFIDATHTDIHSNWMLDPVMFTFTFFKNDVTKSKRAWRPLGFITEFGQPKSIRNKQISSRDKCQDFHKQLTAVFSSLITSQANKGFYWEFKYNNKLFPMNMIPVIILIVGDAQGNHKLAGMKVSFSGTFRVNHSCNCRWFDTDNEKIKCQFMKQSYLQKLCEDGNEEELKLLSQHNIKNAFDEVLIGYHDAGVNALMPSEILHQFFLGLLEYALESFFDTFSETGKVRMDCFGKDMYIYLQHNSDRSMPITYFKSGFTKLTKQKGSEKVGICIIVLLAMICKNRTNITHRLSTFPADDVISSFCYFLERMIIFSEWLSHDKFKKDELKLPHIRIVELMRLFKKCT